MDKIKKHNNCRKLSLEERIYYYWAFRSARASAFADAENFQQILFAIEKLGSYLAGGIYALGHYQECMRKLAEESVFSYTIPTELPIWHHQFDELYKLIKEARNDALHQGVIARHLTDNLVIIALIIEDALMGEQKRKWSDVMVRQVIVAQSWQPISFVRQQMLTHSITYLPIYIDQSWKLIADYEIAAYIGQVKGNTRKSRLIQSIEEAVSDGLRLFGADIRKPNDPIDSMLLSKSNGKPVILIENNIIVGIVAPFDIL